MRALVVACGNTLRGDDGAAHRALALLDAMPGTATRRVAQLTPELAPEVAAADAVVFVDADVAATDAVVTPLGPAGPGALSHHASPEAVVTLARALYGFRGEAYVCRIPAEDLSPGEGLSGRAAAQAAVAARRIAALLRALGGR